MQLFVKYKNTKCNILQLLYFLFTITLSEQLRDCRELGIIEYPNVIRAGMTEEEKKTHARKLNLIRRQLTREQKAELIRQQLKETPRRSNQEIAGSLGVSDKTVGAQRAELEASGEITSTQELIRQKLEENPEKSDRQIAKEVGVSDKTVGVQRKKLTAENSEFPEIPHSRPVSVFNATPREKRALRDDRVIERMQETGSSSPVRTKQELQSEDKAERKAYTLEREIPEGALKLFVADIIEATVLLS